MKIRTCPRCGSTNIKLHLGAMTGMQYKCETCGYIGPLVLEHETERKFKT